MFEFLEIGTLAYRQSFIRNLVNRVEVKLVANKNIPQSRIKGIDIFVKCSMPVGQISVTT